ncbi:MAG: hypothetical protein K2H69_01210 [Alistipes sp.]|nr:hypothetical protein [Alistipes sp.]
MKRSFLLLLLAASFLIGCSDKETPVIENPEIEEVAPDGTHLSEGFIQVYLLPSAMNVRLEGEAVREKEYLLEISFDGERISNREVQTKARHEAIAARYGDREFNDRIVPFSTVALGSDCLSIEVTCDSPIDEAHPAGAPLGDLLTLYGVSFDEYIACGYDDSKMPSYPESFDGLLLYNGLGGTPLIKPLDEVTAADLLLVEPTLYLKLPFPLPVGSHTFTVTARFADTTFEASAKLTIG